MRDLTLKVMFAIFTLGILFALAVPFFDKQ